MSLSPTESPRILIVTPEIAYLPEGITANACQISTGAGPTAKCAAALIATLFYCGTDVHVALPDFRHLFHTDCRCTFGGEPSHGLSVCEERVHLARDRNLFYWNPQTSRPMTETIMVALAFQREVVNHIVPIVQPDLIHCMGWMTGLIPAMARDRDIPCLFSVQAFDTGKTCLSTIEDRGIDAACFWRHLYYDRYPSNYETTRDTVPVDFMASGILASRCFSLDSPVPLRDIVDGRAPFFNENLRRILNQKWEAGNAIDMGQPPSSPFHAAHDRSLFCNYTANSQVFGKRTNKLFLQKKLGLPVKPQSPIFYWPHGDNGLKASGHLYHDIIRQLWTSDGGLKPQLIISDPAISKNNFIKTIHYHNRSDRVAWCDASEPMTRQAYAAADFVLRPTRDEADDSLHLPEHLYGALSIVADNGRHGHPIRLRKPSAHSTASFLFNDAHPEELFTAIHHARAFYHLPVREKHRQIHRIMTESAAAAIQHAKTYTYLKRYEKLLRRPLRPKLQPVFNQTEFTHRLSKGSPSPVHERPLRHHRASQSGSP